jgi:type I restriction enzyme S subunit
MVTSKAARVTETEDAAVEARAPNGYKRTDAGLIPEDWDHPELAEIAKDDSPICYGIVQVGPYTASGIPVLAIKNLNSDYTTDIHRASAEVERAYARSRIRPDDILISVKGTTGRVGIVPSGFHGNISRDLARIRPREGTIPKFCFQMLQSDLAQRRLVVAAVGTTRMELSIAILKKVRIPIPPTKDEQEAIAEALSDADALIESLEQLIAKKRQLKRGAMQELLTGKKRLSGFSGEWQDLFVEDVIIRFFCGPSPTCEERNITGDSEWGALKTTAITWDSGWDWTKHKTLPRSFWNHPDLEIRSGDVIVTKAGPRHRVGVTAWVDHVPKRIIVSGKMIGLRPNPEKAVPLMLAAAIAARQSQVFLDQRTTGMAESQVNFENTVLLRTPIRIPRIEEQTAIAAILTDIDTEIAALEARLAKARQINQGMMQELLTGRIRLK